MKSSCIVRVFYLLGAIACSQAFTPLLAWKPTSTMTTALAATRHTNVEPTSIDKNNRRQVLLGTAGSLAGMFLATNKAHAATSNTDALIADLQLSLDKLKPIPSLLEKNEWDSVRTILKTTPVNQLWNLGDAKNPLLALAKATDEFELIDIKDELSLSLQMCDQLTYDNVFVYYQPGMKTDDGRFV